MSRRMQGFSLLELVVVLAIFALVALLGVQVIRATVLADRRLTEVSESSGELAVAMALLRRDLGAGIGLSFYPSSGGTLPALQVGPPGFSLSVSGLGGVEVGHAGLGRVSWRLDAASGQVLRQVWTTLSPAGPQSAGPEVSVLEDVLSLEVDSFQFRGSWQRGFAGDPRKPNDLPAAVRVRLNHNRFGALETLVSWR